jgi:hypothetical protein
MVKMRNAAVNENRAYSSLLKNNLTRNFAFGDA